jgi:hypothetical protein
MEGTCQAKSSETDRSRLLFRFSSGASALERQLLLPVLTIVWLHRNLLRRMEAIGTITRIVRTSASVGSWVHRAKLGS